jgi:hypothetical protein
MCPEPALLVAYLDGTLFHRDASDVDDHVATCQNCSELLAAMRRVRAEEQRSKSSRRLIMGIAVAAVALAGVGAWVWLRGSTNAPPQESAVARVETPASPSPSAALSSAVSQTTVEQKPVVPLGPQPRRPVAKENSRSTPNAKAPPKPATTVNDAAPVDSIPKPIHVEGDVVIRGRNANRRIIWRTRDRVIDHSINGGATWTTEYTADRTIRAGAFVDANVAWLAGDGGLILRRTKNGWFAATSPGEAAVKSVRASSPSKATVTVEDGRVFSTDNGGVSWSAQ